MRIWEADLRKTLKDPELAAYFANAQAESARELLRAGVWIALTETGGSPAIVIDWTIKE